MWEYILASEKPSKRTEFGLVNEGFYTIPELVEQFNEKHKTQFRGLEEGWLRHFDDGNCHIKTLDGMCGVLIAHKLAIHSYNVGRWYPLIEFMAKKGNYTYMMMSNIVGGDRLAAWKEQGFTPLLGFRNKRTDNRVEIIYKAVPYEAT